MIRPDRLILILGDSHVQGDRNSWGARQDDPYRRVQQHLGQTVAAEKYLRDAISQPSSPGKRETLEAPQPFWQATFQLSLAEFLADDQRLAEARELLETSARTLDALLADPASRGFLHATLYGVQAELADAFYRLDEYQGAIAATRQAEEHLRALPPDHLLRTHRPDGPPRRGPVAKPHPPERDEPPWE